MLRRRGEPTVAATGGNWRGWLLSTMVVLHVDVADLQYFHPKIQTSASFLIKVDFN